jgi:hypothetical protein
VSSLQEYNTGVYLDQQLVAQYIIPLMAPEARFLGLQLFIPVHLKYFGQSQHAAGLLSSPLIFIKFESLSAGQRNAFWHELPSICTKQARILWNSVLLQKPSSTTQGLNFGSTLACFVEAYCACNELELQLPPIKLLSKVTCSC